MNVRLDHVETVAENIKTFWFEPAKPVNYIAGQFIEMYLPHEGADERGQKHWFTLSSSPSEKLISITTKHATDHVSTFKQKLFSLKPGTAIRISEPMGDFVLPKDGAIPLLFVAGGIGVTPMRSMVKWLLDSHEKRPLQLLYGAKTAPELAFLDIFTDYGLQPDIVLSNPPAKWPGQRGHITSDLILRAAEHMVDPLVYISGPEPMTEKLEAGMLAAGFPSTRLVLDFFPGYPPV